ncbi:uncharacterized protein LOC135958601 [Calliphora vicina]|uniref:uncharacterized protein LOC135958601 n=1 Tax=Calliphora vicina TaxID=7373 RepID=UPI00325B5244
MSMANKEARKRAKNYSDEEELVELVEAYKHLIENKKSDAVVWKQKEEAWAKIEEKFSAATGSNRPWKSLRDKYEFIKRKSKTKLSNQTVSSKIAAMLGDSATGLENNYDSDFSKYISLICCNNVFIKEIVCVDENTDWSNWTPTSLKQAKSKELVVGGKSKINLEVNEKSMSTEDFGKEIVCREEKTDWSNWTPTRLKQAKSKELVVGGKRKRNLEDERIQLTILQQQFYRDENTRAQEKHEQEVLSLKLKNEMLQLELAEKKNKTLRTYTFILFFN